VGRATRTCGMETGAQGQDSHGVDCSPGEVDLVGGRHDLRRVGDRRQDPVGERSCERLEQIRSKWCRTIAGRSRTATGQAVNRWSRAAVGRVPGSVGHLGSRTSSV
jgi:hypothetical protein